MDYLLRTNTESQMDEALEAAGILVERDLGDGEMALVAVDGAFLDRIGGIPAVLDEHGNVIHQAHPEYHANLRVSFALTKAQEDLLPTFSPLPTVPYRVFF